jgi:uncharacterized RDD family membrane protein YckC
MSWITLTGTIFVALAIAAAIFYFGGSSLAQFGSSTGMAVLKDAGYGGINIGITLVVILVIFAVIVVFYILSQQGPSYGY